MGLDTNANAAGSNICFICHTYCESCNGTGNINCQSCKSGKYLAIGTSICDTGCPNGQFVKSVSDSVCTACDLGCAVCSTASDVCTNCQ